MVCVTYCVIFAVKIGIMQMRSAEDSLRVCVQICEFRPMQEGHSGKCSDIVDIYCQSDITEWARG